MEDVKVEVDMYYEKCRVLVSALGNASVPDADRETFAWILEEYFAKLGEAIERFLMR